MHLARMLPRFRKAYRSLPEYAERETWSRGAIEDFQLGRVNELWGHANRHVAHYRRLAETIVSAMEVNEGRDGCAVAASWSGDTAMVVADAVRSLTARGAAEDGIVRM